MVEGSDEQGRPGVRQPAMVGLMPKMPQSDAGTRIEPLVSVPRLTGTIPAATAAPEPPLLPPAMRVRSCGFRQGPSWVFSVVKP